MSPTNPVHQALLSLLPPAALPNGIPPHLLRTATTLLSLSHQRASHLKPDEEIARAHVCAEIACKRLRVQLRLPNIKSGNGAPCRPNVYRKLLSFLEVTLEDAEVGGTPRKEVSTPGTGRTGRSTGGRKRNVDALLEDAGGEGGELETPTKKRRTTNNLLATPTKLTGKKTNGFVGKIQASTKHGKNGAEAPDYVLPSIRKLCKAFKTLKMVPHTYTGVCIVLDMSGEWQRLGEMKLVEEFEQQKQDVLGLVVAVYLMTLTRMQKGLMTTELYDAVSKASIETLGMEGEQTDAQAGIEQWIARINDGGWTTESGQGRGWWSSVPEDVIAPLKLSKVQAQSQDVDATEDLEETPKASRMSKASIVRGADQRREELRKQLEEEDPDDVLLPGLGTMMNDAVDYLSEERTAEYELWKADILRRMDAMEGGTESIKKRKGRVTAVAA